MQWLRAHLYLASLLGALLVIVFGILVIANRSGVDPERAELRAWGGVGSNLFDPTGVRTALQPQSEPDNLYSEVKSGPPFYYAPSSELPIVRTQGEDDFDFDAFIALLSAPTGSSGEGSAGETGLDIYSFIPQGLISTSTPQKKMTALQRALYDYGNEAGSHIQSHEEENRYAPQVLKDQFEDREDPAKNAALSALAGSLEDLGERLAAMSPPSEVRAAHQKVAASYRALGAKLALVPDARTDAAVLDAILAYNAEAETYVQNYVALATLLSAHGVTFSPDDPGSVFTFSAVSL